MELYRHLQEMRGVKVVVGMTLSSYATFVHCS